MCCSERLQGDGSINVRWRGSTTTFALFGRGGGWNIEVVGGGGRYFMVGSVRKDEIWMRIMRIETEC